MIRRMLRWLVRVVTILIVRGTLDTSGVRDRAQARSRYGAKREA